MKVGMTQKVKFNAEYICRLLTLNEEKIRVLHT